MISRAVGQISPNLNGTHLFHTLQEDFIPQYLGTQRITHFKSGTNLIEKLIKMSISEGFFNQHNINKTKNGEKKDGILFEISSVVTVHFCHCFLLFWRVGSLNIQHKHRAWKITILCLRPVSSQSGRNMLQRLYFCDTQLFRFYLCFVKIYSYLCDVI